MTISTISSALPATLIIETASQVIGQGAKHYFNHQAQKNQQAHELAIAKRELKQQQEKEKMSMQLMVAGTLASEAVKIGASIMAYKQATYAIDAELTKAEQNHQLELASIKADEKEAKRQTKAQERAFLEQAKSFRKDKKGLYKLYQEAIQKAMNAQDMAEYQRMMDTANYINAQLDNIRHDELCNRSAFNEGMARIGRRQRRGGHDGRVLDGECHEVS